VGSVRLPPKNRFKWQSSGCQLPVNQRQIANPAWSIASAAGKPQPTNDLADLNLLLSILSFTYIPETETFGGKYDQCSNWSLHAASTQSRWKHKQQTTSTPALT